MVLIIMCLFSLQILRVFFGLGIIPFVTQVVIFFHQNIKVIYLVGGFVIFVTQIMVLIKMSKFSLRILRSFWFQNYHICDTSCDVFFHICLPGLCAKRISCQLPWSVIDTSPVEPRVDIHVEIEPVSSIPSALYSILRNSLQVSKLEK